MEIQVCANNDHGTTPRGKSLTYGYCEI